MSLTKQPISVNFSKGIDTKSDPKQIPLGTFSSLQNSIFGTTGRLTKRNGFAPLTPLSDDSNTFLTTFNGNLTAIGTSLNAYASASDFWFNKGTIQPISLSTLPLIRSNTNQSQLDTAVASNGFVCTVFTDNPASGTIYRYAIADSVTGQNIIAPTTIASVTGSPRVFVLGAYFIIIHTDTNALNYIAISTTNPSATPITGQIASAYVPKTTLSFDAVVYSNQMYIAYNNTTGGQNIRLRSLSATLVLSAAKIFAGEICTMMSMCVDATMPSAPIIWAAYYDLAGTAGKAFAVDPSLQTVLAPTAIISTGTYLNITCTAKSNVLTFLVEQANQYSYTSVDTDLIRSCTLTQAGVLGTIATLVRSVGLASKAFLYNNVSYFLGVYQSAYQPTYFLLNESGKVISRIAYSNSGGYKTVGLPNVTLTGAVAQIGYLIKDLLSSTNKTQGLAAASSTPVYSQTGLNLVSFNFEAHNVNSSEIGSNLNLTGGFIAGYDGYTVTEQNFFLWPDNVIVTTSTSGGLLADQTYFYVATYEWADNAGNVFRSAPSIPISQVTSGGNTSTNTINVPTLRLTYKTANPVKIVLYRWSTAQQTYYAIKSPSVAPTFNNLTVDSVAIVDTLADASIIGNPILYTTGGVIEDIAPPSSSIMTLFNNRLWLVDAEDTNLLWFSKQVIESTPIEMSDLLTEFVAPTIGSQGSTGPITSLAPLDDKLIIGKNNAFYYIQGIGPDNTGANNQYSDPIFITASVGCANQKSIVMIPQGLMFQSDKGIWLLSRDLSTSYIGQAVEALTEVASVESVLSIPGTTQVRFTMDSGITIMYDYFYNEWATFTGIPGLSSTLYQGLHTYINSSGLVFQETPGQYLDNSSPVLMSFTTGWLNLAGLQGYERFYDMLLLGEYITPFKLNVQIAYDYNPSPSQATILSPVGYQPPWGGDQLYGDSPVWGGINNVYEARLFPRIQKCESFQISVNELYDSTYGTIPGAGLTLSGINLTVGLKKGTRTSKASQSFG